jgi:hypothetical protein
MRDKKRAIDKFVTLNVQQISATLEQVRLKAGALAGFVGAQHGAQRTYALLTLANKLISQCEVQVRGGLEGALQEGWVGWVAQPWNGGVGCWSCMRLGAAPTHPPTHTAASTCWAGRPAALQPSASMNGRWITCCCLRCLSHHHHTAPCHATHTPAGHPPALLCLPPC